MPPQPRDEIGALARAVHGAADAAELATLGLRPEDVLDFSANINPFGPSPAVRAAVATASVRDYPDREAAPLRAVLAAWHSVAEDHIVVGNGACELIWLIALAFLRPGDRALVLEPTFSEYARSAQMMGATVVPCRASVDDEFRHRPEEVSRLLAETGPRVLFLANPNNPTGVLLAGDQVLEWARAFSDVLFVVDEAYLSFTSRAESILEAGRENVLVLRSMTKDFALAGLRLGYAVGDPRVIEALRRVRPPWSVSAPAQAGGIAALRDRDSLESSLSRLAEARAELVAGLTALGVKLLPSAVHYFLAEVGDADDFRERLLKQGMLVRAGTSFGLPEFVRVSPRTPEENAQLVAAWRTLSAPRPVVSSKRANTPSGARLLMIQGTSSSVGKSLLVAALCRMYRRRGVRVAPFKAQNMSNNAAVCGDGSEIGRAQAVQARAAGIEPTADMNPVLLKPEADSRSQVIVLGKTWQTLQAGSFYRRKEELWPTVTAALDRLRSQYELILIEGAGSPVELNLRSTDIVNMAVARHAQCPVLLVGDIDRGGIFPQLLGTLDLLAPDERALVRGLIVNKFRGDPRLFVDGVRILEERGGVPVLGVVPYLPKLAVPEEDAVALDHSVSAPATGIDIAVIQLPRIANFDDFDPLRAEANVRLRFVRSRAELGRPDAIVLPGTKSTLADLAWLRAEGLADATVRHAQAGGAVVGICGGYQMLGRTIRDLERVESAETEAEGLGLLPVDTVFARTKATFQAQARVLAGAGWLQPLTGQILTGYEIHMGRTEGASPWLEIVERNGAAVRQADGACGHEGRVWGCYLHGLFANEDFRRAWLATLGHRAGIVPVDPFEESIERLADAVEAALDAGRLQAISAFG